MCVPHRADDDYAERLAALCRARIGDGQSCLYLERSNEAWNWQFAQAKHADAAARAAVAAGDAQLNDPPVGAWEWRHRHHARRTLEIGATFRRAFDPGDTRVRPVLATSVNPAPARDVLPWVARHFGPAAPYFGH